jgi:hypothetical protein
MKSSSKGLFQQLLDILSPPSPPRPSYDDNDLEAGGEGVAILLNDLQQVPEEAPFDPNDFVQLYSEYMREHYGRPAQYTTDLFCCMLPITVEITADQVQTLHRYWWLPVQHPVTSILLSHRVPNCGEVDAGICGSCIIYPDSYVVEWTGRILEYFKDANIELQSPPPPPPPSTEFSNNNNEDTGTI